MIGVLVVTAAASAQTTEETESAVRASAPAARIHMRLPDARHEAMASALRLELAARGAVVETEVGAAPAGIEPREWRDRATHVGWVSLEGGALAGAEVVVVAVRSNRVARARVSHAWDLVEPRAIGVLVASLVDELSTDDAPAREGRESIVVVSEGTRASRGHGPGNASERARAEGAGSEGSDRAGSGRAGSGETGSQVGSDDPRPGVGRTHGDVPEPPAAEVAATENESCSLCERFTFFAGIGPMWTKRGGQTAQTFTQELGFYGRVSPWVSIGLRMAGGGGYSSVGGGILDMRLAAPSVLVSRRIRLGRVLKLELGVHTEGALYIDYVQHAAPESNLLSFGISAGAIVGLDFGERHGLRIDATMGVHGLGGTQTATMWTATFLYTRRIGRSE